MDLPKLKDYGNSPSTRFLNIGPVTVWFSYETPIAFRVDGGPQRVLDYKGSRTTFRHLNMIDGGNKDARLSQTEFQKLWEKEVVLRAKA